MPFQIETIDEYKYQYLQISKLECECFMYFKKQQHLAYGAPPCYTVSSPTYCFEEHFPTKENGYKFLGLLTVLGLWFYGITRASTFPKRVIDTKIFNKSFRTVESELTSPFFHSMFFPLELGTMEAPGTQAFYIMSLCYKDLSTNISKIIVFSFLYFVPSSHGSLRNRDFVFLRFFF